jgi:hypothetical protein
MVATLLAIPAIIAAFGAVTRLLVVTDRQPFNPSYGTEIIK